MSAALKSPFGELNLSPLPSPKPSSPTRAERTLRASRMSSVLTIRNSGDFWRNAAPRIFGSTASSGLNLRAEQSLFLLENASLASLPSSEPSVPPTAMQLRLAGQLQLEPQVAAASSSWAAAAAAPVKPGPPLPAAVVESRAVEPEPAHVRLKVDQAEAEVEHAGECESTGRSHAILASHGRTALLLSPALPHPSSAGRRIRRPDRPELAMFGQVPEERSITFPDRRQSLPAAFAVGGVPGLSVMRRQLSSSPGLPPRPASCTKRCAANTLTSISSGLGTLRGSLIVVPKQALGEDSLEQENVE